MSSIEENIFDGLMVQVEDLKKCEVSESNEREEEEKYFTSSSCNYATASSPPFDDPIRPREGLGDRLSFYPNEIRNLTPDTGAVKHPLHERETDVSEGSLKHSLNENDDVSEMTLEVEEE
ncbi:MAG: hypothetical protein ACK55Z_09615, partial [bacterium]